MPETLTFDEAMADARDRFDQQAVLLGNGFSIDYSPTIFDYDSLAAEASLSGLSVAKDDLFATLGSSNFEVVIEKLKASAALERLYGDPNGRADVFEADALVVRNGLADALAERHPENALSLTDDEVMHARRFLSQFGRIFTLSYDLLLYWVTNRADPGLHVVRADGFEWPTWKDRDRLIWKAAPSRPQRVFHLHGALHLFEEENNELRKLSYWDHGSLVDALRDRLNRGHYPLVVTEGTRAEKEARIDQSLYLRTGLRRFGAVKGALFLHGVSLSPNDDHIFELIESDACNIEALYVGVRDPNSESGKKLIERARDIRARRRANGGKKLRLRFYSAPSANVWRDAP